MFITKNSKSILQGIILAIIISSAACSPVRHVSTADDGKIDITFIQVNDVYEITPLEAGKVGGMARVATLKKEYKQVNPNTFLVMAGDFLSPSVYNSLQYEGQRIRGKQMVESMNAAGFDFAVFGNHEFDITEKELQSRLNESRFQWISSNTFHQNGNVISPFVKNTTSGKEPIPETFILTVKDEDGTSAKIGFIGITLPFTKTNYVTYADPLLTAETLYNRIKDSCDAVVAITHQLMDDDIQLAQKIPGLALIMGGHEHDMRFQKAGNVNITKAHANARSAYIVKLAINKKNHSFTVHPQLKWIDASEADDPATDSVVKKWTDIADKNYASLGFDAKKIVLSSGDPLDGRESEVRRKPTNLTKLIVAAMQEACPSADVVIVNSGSIRVDDILTMPISEYDIIRSLPFGGGIREVEMKGSLLIKILETGKKNIGIGGFLHYSPDVIFNENTNTWLLQKEPIKAEKIYRVALTDYLLTGGETNMDFLKPDNPDIVKLYPAPVDKNDPRFDIRLAIIQYLKKSTK
jgi:2',3'-cyclic-nucleotide 2'-phosphodiesterase (5'-nucleotidase family)